MRRVLIFSILVSLFFGIYTKVPAEYSADINTQNSEGTLEEETPTLPSIFIWQLPETAIYQEEAKDADDYTDNAENKEEEAYSDIFISTDDETTSTLKGYLDYLENSNSIGLDVNNEYAINTRVPKKLKEDKLIKNNNLYPTTTFSKNVYARTGNLQYNIAPFETSTEIKKGNFLLGTSYNESIDTSDLGFTTSFYTKYDTKHFSLSTSYDKNSGVAYSQVVDKFTLTPEIKLNKYISLRDSITADITRNRTKNEIMLSIKPTKDDRVRFEFGTNYTFDQNNELIRSQVKFQTQFKL